jgi:hypothetical protein
LSEEGINDQRATESSSDEAAEEEADAEEDAELDDDKAATVKYVK